MNRRERELVEAERRFRYGASPGLSCSIEVRASFDELRQLSPEQCAAFMEGVAKVLSANPYRESGERARIESRCTAQGK